MSKDLKIKTYNFYKRQENLVIQLYDLLWGSHWSWRVAMPLSGPTFPKLNLFNEFLHFSLYLNIKGRVHLVEWTKQSTHTHTCMHAHVHAHTYAHHPFNILSLCSSLWFQEKKSMSVSMMLGYQSKARRNHNGTYLIQSSPPIPQERDSRTPLKCQNPQMFESFR